MGGFNRMHISISVDASTPSAIGRGGLFSQIAVTPSYLGLGFFFAALVQFFGLRGPVVTSGSAEVLGPLLVACAWGFLGACVVCGVVPFLRSGGRRFLRQPLAAALYVAMLVSGVAVAVLLCGGWTAGLAAVGVVFGALCGGCSVAWCVLYSTKGSWDLIFHASCSMLLSCILVMLGFLFGSAIESLGYTLVLLAISFAFFLVAALRVQVEQGRGDVPLKESVRDFLHGQWVALLGIFIVAFAYGLRWQTVATGLAIDKFYSVGDWPLLIGPILGVVIVVFFALRTEDAYPQRALCLTLLPLATAIMLVVPIVNPASGFYESIDFQNTAGAVLEFVLDVASETAVTLFILVTLAAVLDAPRIAGISRLLVAAIYLGISAFGVVLGVCLCDVFGRNGRVLCVLIWTAYLLLLLFRAVAGKNESAGSIDKTSDQLFSTILRDAVLSVAPRYGLSKRESEILCYVARGYSNTYIAQNLCIAESTVRTHISHIFEKMGVSSREELFELIDNADGSGELRRS